MTASFPAAAGAAAPTPLRIAVVGAGPVGLALALQAARRWPWAEISVFDARAIDKDLSADGRTLALSLGSVQLLRQLGAYAEGAAEPIETVHVSQAPPTPRHRLFGPGGQPQVWLRAADLGVAQLGAVLRYGDVVAPLQAAWLAACAAEPLRLHARFGQPVAALKPCPGGVEVDAGIAETYTLAVVAEGGVFAEQARKAVARDYAQTAWVGQVELDPASPARTAYERFTRAGPLALLPLPSQGGTRRAALVWCVPQAEDELSSLSDAQRLAVLNTLLPPGLPPLRGLSPLKHFALGLNAERHLVQGRVVRIGNAAQTLHPVAGQGLNLGLRDAYALVDALATDGLQPPSPSAIDAGLTRLNRRRAPDRWSMIGVTDLLARSFTWRWPGLPGTRGLALAALEAAGPLKRALARQMMFGRR